MANLIQWYAPEVGTGWDSTNVYSSTNKDGPFVLIATVTPITKTMYWDETGDTGTWYRIAFFKTSSGLEGPMSEPFYSSSESKLYTNPTELRKFMQFSVTDFPTDEETTLLIEQAHVQINMDITGSSTTSGISTPSKLKLLALLLSSSYVMRSLAMRALSKGYISVSLEGGNIVKAHDALLRMADYLELKYHEQLAKDTIDFTKTRYLNQVVDASTQQDIIDIQNGLSDALDWQSNVMPSYGKRGPRSAN